MIQPRTIAWSAYAVAAAMILFPLGDASLTLYPWHVAEARWRFGALGVLANAQLVPLVGLLVVLVTAWAHENRVVARAIGVAGFAGAVCWLASLGLFALDALQTRAMVRPDMIASFNAAAISGAAKGLICALILGIIGLAGVRSGRALRPSGGAGGASYPLVATVQPKSVALRD